MSDIIIFVAWWSEKYLLKHSFTEYTFSLHDKRIVLIFLIYTNDFILHLNIKNVLLSDDTNLFIFDGNVGKPFLEINEELKSYILGLKKYTC